MTDDLRQLWKQVCTGDAGAWQELVLKYSALVFTVARRTGLSVPDAEDCAQETWLTLYRRRRSIRDPEALPAWLIKTTHRNGTRLARRLKPGSSLDAHSSLVDTSPLPDEEIDMLHRQAAIYDALPHLDRRCRLLIEALFLSPQKNDYQRVAAELGIKPNSLGPLRSRCLEKLKKILKKMGHKTD